MLPTSESAFWWLASRLLDGSVYGAAVIALVWLACRWIRAIPPAARAGLWWLASLKLVVALLPLPSFGVAVLPSTAVVAAPATLMPASRLLDPPLNTTVRVPDASPGPIVPAVLVVLVVVWLAVVTLQSVQLFAAYVTLQRTVRRSAPVAAADAATVGRLAGLLALRAVPTVRVSSEIRTPLVVGIVRPTVLLPATESALLTNGEREMAICHELAHVRRRDLLFGWVPAIAERLFFFHPLALVAAREYLAEREAACDALVVRLLEVAPHDYGQMLVRLGVGRRLAVGRLGPVFTATGASPSMSSLRRRLDMLHDLSATRSRRAGMILFAVLATAALMPFHLTAKSAQQPSAAPPAVPAAPARTAPIPPATVATQSAVAAQKPAPKPSQAAPATKATPAQEEELRKAVADQRESMREIERALMMMRRQFEELLVDAERARADANASNAAQRAVQQHMQVAAEQQRSDRASTPQFLEERLRELMVEKEATDRRLKQLADEIEAIRQQLDRVR